MDKTKFFDQFVNRHIGIGGDELSEMLSKIGVESLDQLMDETIPENIRLKGELDLRKPSRNLNT
jgi:glycine dehydrogenase